MLQIAQDVFKLLHDRFRTTLRMMANLAESIGVPPLVTSLLNPTPPPECSANIEMWPKRYSLPPPVVQGTQWTTQRAESSEAKTDNFPLERKRVSGKKRGLVVVVDLSDKVRPLKVRDAIQGSTYLARIVWSLGVAAMEGTGPLRPADIARMIMSRSAVSLEPPNVARYIRRSKPTCITIAHSERSSNFYQLNDEGQALFDTTFRLKA